MNVISGLSDEAESDIAGEAARFGDAIRVWAREYAVRYRQAPSPKPDLEDSRADLRRWLTGYCAGAGPDAFGSPGVPPTSRPGLGAGAVG